MKDLILTDGGKTYLGRLDLKKEYTVYDSMNRSLYHRNGMQLKRNFDDVTRSGVYTEETKQEKHKTEIKGEDNEYSNQSYAANQQRK